LLIEYRTETAKLGNEIHVWQAALDRDARSLAELESLLSPDEKARAGRFRFEKDRNRYIVGRGMLRRLLGAYAGKAPGELEFTYGEHGKPALAGENESASGGINFNLAHSADLVVYAIARKRTLGIDVERIKPESAGEGIARRYFSRQEVEELLTLRVEERAEAFFRCWTRKEAYLKALGTGLQTPLDSFSVSLSPGKPAKFLAGVEPRWRLFAFQPADCYVAALVHDGVPCGISCMFLDRMAE
jgi:4'-phosphopantetheinyl transferase